MNQNPFNPQLSETRKVIGTRLREIRKRNNLTVVELAKRLGCSHSKISRLENGIGEPAIDFIFQFATSLNMHFEDLMEHLFKELRKEWAQSPHHKHVSPIKDKEPIERQHFSTVNNPLVDALSPFFFYLLKDTPVTVEDLNKVNNYIQSSSHSTILLNLAIHILENNDDCLEQLQNILYDELHFEEAIIPWQLSRETKSSRNRKQPDPHSLIERAKENMLNELSRESNYQEWTHPDPKILISKKTSSKP